MRRMIISITTELTSHSLRLGNAQSAFLKAAPKGPLQFLSPHSGPTEYDADRSRTARLETNRRYLDQRRKELRLDIAEMEQALDIQNTWQPTDQEYREVKQWIATRKYHVALGNLQRLVVQRLFELHKMNLSQTGTLESDVMVLASTDCDTPGYRMRRHIAKSLQARSRAIRNAIRAYNAAATALEPARPTLDWETVSHYRFLQQFTLLNDTRADLRDKKWAEPAVREAIRQARRVARAREELDHVDNEALRVRTHIRDEELLFASVLEDLIRTRDPVYGAVAAYVRRRHAANRHILISLNKLADHPRFTGQRTPSVRPGGSLPALAPSCTVEQILAFSSEQVDLVVSGEDDSPEDEHAETMFTALTDFIESVHI